MADKRREFRWGILVGAFIVGLIVYSFIPKLFWYIIFGLLLVTGAIAYLIYRKKGIEPLQVAWRQVYNWLTTRVVSVRSRETLAPLPSHAAYKLKGAVGNRCESLNCSDPQFPNVDVHHIIPRNQDGSTHKLNNLLVLCPLCHEKADHGLPARKILQQHATRPDRFSTRPDLVKDWPYDTK